MRLLLLQSMKFIQKSFQISWNIYEMRRILRRFNFLDWLIDLLLILGLKFSTWITLRNCCVCFLLDEWINVKLNKVLLILFLIAENFIGTFTIILFKMYHYALRSQLRFYVRIRLIVFVCICPRWIFSFFFIFNSNYNCASLTEIVIHRTHKF